MDLITIKAKTRGKNTREVEYQGIGKFVQETETIKKDGKEVQETVQRLVTEGVCTDIKDALATVGGNMQALLDRFVIGFNLEAYRAVSDVLAEFIKPSWSDANVAAFRLAVNNLTKLGIELEAAVTVASSKLPS